MSDALNQPSYDLDKISDHDFDFLCDLALNLVFETRELTETTEQSLQRINDRLNADKYDLNVELDYPNPLWWSSDELPELLESQEAASSAVTLELNVISITTTGSHSGERVVVASVHVDVDSSLENIEQHELNNIQIKWLPELDN